MVKSDLRALRAHSPQLRHLKSHCAHSLARAEETIAWTVSSRLPTASALRVQEPWGPAALGADEAESSLRAVNGQSGSQQHG